MTTPQTEEQQNHTTTEVEAAVVALIAAWLASRAAIRATLLPVRLVDSMTSLGISARAARAAGKMALSVPMSGRSRYGAPTKPDMPAISPWLIRHSPPQRTPSMAKRVAAEEPSARAQYIVNAARRLTDGLVGGTFLDDLRKERTHLQSHLAAGRKRRAAAQVLDEVAARSLGGLMRWQAVMDDRTTPDCRVLNGVVFTLDDPPGIPGGEHVHCRCTAVPVVVAQAA